MADTSTDDRRGQHPRDPDEQEREDDVALAVEDLTKIYDDGTLAVDDISFDVHRGEFCVLIGPSGCGKTTTLHSIVGKVEPTHGTVVLDGTDITGTPTYERDIGLVFQDFQLFPHRTVEENVAYGLERLGVDADTRADRVGRTLELMRLGDLADRTPGDISAGQKQRVALARSLVLEPALLLLDEPLGDLDYKMQKRMERELLRIHRMLDTTFVYVTHDQNQAMRLGDRIVVMNDGRIEQSGAVSDIYNRPATAFVASFVGDSNIFTGEVVGEGSRDATVVVRTDLGEFEVSATNLRGDPAALEGRDLPFVVRPQFLRLDGTADNAVAAAVEDVIHQPGRGTQLLLDAGDPDRPVELQFVSHERLDVEDGTVTVGWDAADAILLEEISVVPDVDLETDILGE